MTRIGLFALLHRLFRPAFRGKLLERPLAAGARLQTQQGFPLVSIRFEITEHCFLIDIEVFLGGARLL